LVIPQNRRRFLAWLSRAGSAASLVTLPAEAPALPPGMVPAGTMFQLGPERYVLEADPPQLVQVPRWDWPELQDVPQPEPVEVEVMDANTANIGQVVIRRWRDGDPHNCKLCGTCRAHRPDGPHAVCMRGLPHGVTVTAVDGLISERDLLASLGRDIPA
jgi:hypothetical protein